MTNKNKIIPGYSNLSIEITSIIIIMLAMAALLSYYLNRFTKITDIGIIIVVLILSIDSFKYFRKARVHAWQYGWLTSLFLIVVISHSLRLFFGPVHCSLFNIIVSIYVYDAIAIIIGLLLVSFSVFLMHRRSGIKYHHIAGILVGIAMTINHIIKIVIGKCI